MTTPSLDCHGRLAEPHPEVNGTRDGLRGETPIGHGVLVVVRGRESRPHGEGGQVVSTEYNREVCRMQDAETVLNVIRERGERELPLENIYRLLYNRNLYLRAYGRIYSNQGATTKGTTAETVDGMSLAKIDRIIDELRYERFRWTPVRRVNLPKPNGGTRPLGIPTWTDKLLQEVIRMILEAYYEPQFSDRSHGFRPGRGCHTALSNVTTHWTGVRWFVRGRHQRVLRQHRPRCPVVGARRQAPRQPIPTSAEVPTESRLHGGLEIWPHAERYAARRRGQPHPLQHLPRPVGQVCRERADTSPHPRHRPERQPRVHTLGEPSGSPEAPGEPHAGIATAQADATTAVRRSLRPRFPPVTLRTLRGRLRAGFHRAKGRSSTGKRVLGDVPARTRSSWSYPKEKTLITHATSQAGRGFSATNS